MNVDRSPDQADEAAGNPDVTLRGVSAHRKRARSRIPWTMMLVLLAVAYLQWPMLKGVFYRVFGVDSPVSSIAWREDFATATVEAKAHDKPVLLVFGAAWCAPCNAMKHEVWPDAAVSQVVNSDYVPLYVDVDNPASASVARRYGIRGIPAVLVVDANGDVIRQESYMSRSTALDFLTTDAA